MSVSVAGRFAGAAVVTLGLCAAHPVWAQGSDASRTVQELTRTIRSDSQSSEEIAQAFYRRGLAYRELGQHANAAADFTSALWLRSLSSEDEASAREYRSAAYGALGIGGSGQAQAAPVQAPASRTSRFNPFARGSEGAPPPAAPPPRQSAQPDRPPVQPIPEFRTSVVAENRPRSPEPSQPAPAPEPRAEPEAPVRTAAAEPAAQPASGRIGRFFGGLWSSDGERQQDTQASGGWGDATTVSAAGEASAGTDTATPARGGSYRLQVASVRSESEAEAAWQDLAARHQELIGDREPIVERADLGSLGTFYRVQLGPFADRREPLQLCNAFKRGGVECFLVVQ